MVEIPEDEFSERDLQEWYKAKQELARVKSREMLLRMKVFRACFPVPKEGTNSFELPDGYVLKATYGLNRDVDMGAFQVLKPMLEENNISADALVQYRASLKKAEYNKLTEEERRLVDQALIIKPGSPSMDIVKPKKKASAGTVGE